MQQAIKIDGSVVFSCVATAIIIILGYIGLNYLTSLNFLSGVAEPAKQLLFVATPAVFGFTRRIIQPSGGQVDEAGEPLVIEEAVDRGYDFIKYLLWSFAAIIGFQFIFGFVASFFFKSAADFYYFIANNIYNVIVPLYAFFAFIVGLFFSKYVFGRYLRFSILLLILLFCELFITSYVNALLVSQATGVKVSASEGWAFGSFLRVVIFLAFAAGMMLGKFIRRDA